MDILSNLAIGFGIAFSPANILFCFLGCLVGTLVGILPGIGPLATLAILLPVTFQIPSVSSIIMLCGIFYGAMYGGSTTAILINIPGEAASVVTCLDGYKMAIKGLAGKALGIAAISSFIAGSISNLGLNLLSPLLVELALKFGPPEYFSILTLGFVVCVFMIGGEISKTLIMIAFGIFVSAVGMDIVAGTERFTFGSINLVNGFDLVAVIMGMFGISEILLTVEQHLKREIISRDVKGILPNIKDFKNSFWPIIRGSVLGFFIGIVPGGGPVSASFMSYGIERKVSRHPEKFGTGVIEAVAGPEAANNAAVAGSLIPLLSLGLPVNAVTALLLGSLIIHGVQPGPMLMTQNPEIFWGVIVSMYIGNTILLILNLPLIRIWVQFLKIPYWILFPLIFLMCVVGSYTSNSNIFDVWVMIGFGVLGYCLRKFKYELSPFVLALVLGPQFEQALRQSLIMSKNPMIFLTRPISGTLIVLTIAILIWMIWSESKKVK